VEKRFASKVSTKMAENGSESDEQIENESEDEEQFENGSEIFDDGEDEHWQDVPNMKFGGETEEWQIFKVSKELIREIVQSKEGLPLIHRTRRAFMEKGPILKEVLGDLAGDLVSWVHRAGPWQGALVIVVGSILLLALTGLGVFMLFFLAATIYAITIGLLLSLVTVGGFMAILFTCLAVFYVGALASAAFVISTTTLLTIAAIVVASGSVAFFWLVWQGTRKSLNITKDSLVVTLAALSALIS
jgi:hypothetical protein